MNNVARYLKQFRMSTSKPQPAADRGGECSSRTPARSILITSTEQTCEAQGNTLGEYLLNNTFSDSISYRQRHTVGSPYCQLDQIQTPNSTATAWIISMSGVGIPLLYNQANTSKLPLSGWFCSLVLGDEWKADRSLSISVAESPPACTAIAISAGPEVTRAVPDYLGDFTPTGQYSMGRPVFTNNKGKYLSMRNTDHGWCVSDGVNNWHGIVSPSSTGSPCPADPRNSYSTRYNQKSWLYWRRSGDLEGDIVVTCKDHDWNLDYYEKALISQNPDSHLRSLVLALKSLLGKQTIGEMIEGDDQLCSIVRIVLNYCCVEIRERLERDFPSELYQSLDTPERISTYIRDTMLSGSSGLRKYRLFTVGHQGCGKSSLNHYIRYIDREKRI